MNCAGDMGVHQYLGGVLWRLSTVMHSVKRKRSPEQFILAGFPIPDTYPGD